VLRGRTVLVGVSGGIAAYKTCELVRWLRRREAAVVVVMTPAAERFVTPLTFEALSGNPVVTSLWGEQKHDLVLPETARRKTTGKVGHIDLAEAADVVVLAPATADLIARLVHGEAPDALTTIVLASRARLVVAPSMDFGMWRHAATQENVRVLRRRGAVIVGPGVGELASGLMGPGRLADIEEIGAAVELAAARRASLAGVRVLIGAGRTEEPLDPVRVLTNRSSGRMGFALAEAARDRGAEVTLVAGPASIEPPLGVTLAGVTTAAEMERALQGAVAGADVVLMAAAVADYRPRRAAREKLKRGPAPLTLALEPNPDILAGLAATRRPGQVFVGFALETSRGLERARAKLAAKGLDLVALNAPAQGLGGETSVVTLVEARTARKLPEQSKREVAEAILDRVLELRAARQQAAAKPKPKPAKRPTRPAARSKRSGKAR
jgi:phosphopantothenoylcysteine decarboxylase / phosphopantothenate---cysteine ligase